MTHTSTELKQVLALADACAGDWEAVRPHLVVQALRDLVARVQELEASQARVPLSDAEIFKMDCTSIDSDESESSLWVDRKTVLRFARAIEAAHGITQEKQG